MLVNNWHCKIKDRVHTACLKKTRFRNAMYMKARILFVGNSFTARNNLSNLLTQLVEAGGKGVLEWELVSAGGTSPRQHFKKGGIATLLRDAPWDAVVLQEQSTLPAKNITHMTDNVRDLDTLIGQVSAFRKGGV